MCCRGIQRQVAVHFHKGHVHLQRRMGQRPKKLQLRILFDRHQIQNTENLEYETYLNKEVSGRDLTTAVNRAVDNNEKNKVSKDEKGFYIGNDINSVIIEIKISDNDTTYKMETLYNGGMPTFIQYYGDISFECTKIEYNKSGRVSFMIFEQKTS